MKHLPRRLTALLLCALLLLPAARAGFSDVAADSWYFPAITEMAQLGLLEGYPDGSFGPDDPITAAQLVTIAARCAGLSPTPGQSAHWAAGTLAAALEAGWYDWDELPPTGEDFDRPISRQLAVKILMKALLPDARGDYAAQAPQIKDFSALPGRYYDPVLAAYAAGVVTGDGAGCFRPLDPLSRAEACALFLRALDRSGGPVPTPPLPPTETPPQTTQPPIAPLRGGVTENGPLHVSGTHLCGESGDPVLLRGMSSHGLQWYGQFSSAEAMAATAAYGANVFRLAMYTAEGGYLSQPEAMEAAVTAGVEAAIQNDMYVIIDWHILSDGDPMAHVAEAEAFFSSMAARYADTPNVIYEICNEPNGTITWAETVKPYAQRLVSAIRAHSQGVILIGSPTWSQDIHLAAADPVAGENLMYTLHFYAGTHGQWLRDRAAAALAAGLPLFVSEWGVSRADGSGGVFLEESRLWLDFLDANGIGWCGWSLCDKSETSAALRPGAAPGGPWTEQDLTEAGRFLFSRFAAG